MWDSVSERMLIMFVEIDRVLVKDDDYLVS